MSFLTGKFGLLTVGRVVDPPPMGTAPGIVEVPGVAPVILGHTPLTAEGGGNPDIVFFLLTKTPTMNGNK